MTWGTMDDASTGELGTEIDYTNAPIWILGVAALLGLIGFATRLFMGLGGAYAAYGFGLLAFASILVFRRRYGVLSQTTFVSEPAGLDVMVSAAFLFTAVEILFAVWPIATEVSRG